MKKEWVDCHKKGVVSKPNKSVCCRKGENFLIAGLLNLYFVDFKAI